MFTPARIVALVGVFSASFVSLANDKLPWYAVAALGAVCAVAQAVSAFSAPVQNTKLQNDIAKDVVNAAKGL